MKKYEDIDGDSGVDSYEIDTDSIAVLFKSGSARKYWYNYSSAGPEHVEKMKELAVNGDGLNAYINKHVKKKYAYKS